MITKKKATYLEEPIEIGDIIKDYWVDGTEETDVEPDYYLVLDELEDTYLVLMINTGKVMKHDLRYDPSIQYEKVG